jgi:hypothetical protein
MGGDESIIDSTTSPANSPQIWGRDSGKAETINVGTNRGGSSHQPKAPTGTVQTTKTEYSGPKPGLDLPEYDKSKVKAYRQKIAGPAMRKLRSEMRRAMSASYENPNVRRHILRGALEGYGIGLGKITADSERAASSRYAQEYGQQYQVALQTYQAAMQSYLSTAVRTTTSRNQYGYESGISKDAYRQRQLDISRRGLLAR